MVDDNDHQHELFKVYSMMSSRVDTLHALSLQEALPMLSTDSPDLVLMDHRLHPYDSFQDTIPLVRAAGYDGCLVVISADVNDRDFADAAELGVTRCLNKFDFTLENFDDLVIGVLDEFRKTAD